MRKFVFDSFLLLVLISFGWGCRFQGESQSVEDNTVINELLTSIDRNPRLPSDSVMLLARKSLSLSQELKYKSGIARSHQQLGIVHYRIGNLFLAIDHLHASLNLFRESDQNSGQAEIHSSLGSVHLRLENFPQTLFHLKEAHLLFSKENNSRGKAHVFGQIGQLYEKSQQYDSALHYQERALEHFLVTMDSAELVAIYDNTGSIYEDLGVYDEAKENFQKAYQLSRELGEVNDAMVSLNNMGDVYRKQGLYDSAIALTRTVYRQALSYHNNYQIQAAARDLGKTYFAMNIMDSAYHYLNESYQLNDVIFGEEMAKEIANAQTIFEVDKKQQTIAMLEKERTFSNKITIIGGTATLILMLLIFYGSYLRTSRNRKERKLLQTENELSKVELVNAQLNEEKLKAELENKRLEESQLQMQLEMKNNALSRSALHLIQKNEFLEALRANLKKIKKSEKDDVHQKIRKLAKSIDTSFNLDDDWEEFENIFNQLHTDFFDRLREKHPDLTNTEVRLCAMIHTNLHSHEIASIMSISSDSLRIARYRLRKKLGLEKGANLFNYITGLT